MFPTTQNSALNLAAALTESKINETTSGAGKAFMKFDFKSGSFNFGRDAQDITNEEILINTNTLSHGWVLWANGSATKNLVPFTNPLPLPMDAQAGAEPSEGRGFDACFLDDEHTTLVFETNSYGGRQGFDALFAQVRSKAIQGETEFLYPLVKLTSTNYKHKQGNTIYNPSFEIVAWMDTNGNRQNEVSALEAPEADKVEESAVRRRRA